jgi:hypothetical protein
MNQAGILRRRHLTNSMNMYIDDYCKLLMLKSSCLSTTYYASVIAVTAAAVELVPG